MTDPQTPTRTLIIERPFGLVFLRAFLILLIAWGLAEGLVRLAVGAGLLTPPRIGSVNAELDSKMLLFDEYVNEKGPVDCIFLGSSQLDEAVDPAVFDEVFRSESGLELRCFNFSIGTMTASGDGRIAMLLARKYNPRLLFIGISARDFSDDFGELTRPLLNDPWVRYSLGEFTLSGWLTEHSYAYRELLTIRSALNPDYMALHNRLSFQLTDSGYLLLEGTDLSNPKKNFIPNFELAKEDIAGLEEAAALSSNSLQVIFVEVPVHHSFIPYYVQADSAAYDSLFVEPVSAYFSGKGLPFWHTQHLMRALVPDEGWADVKHLNKTGAEIFSTWLAQRTSQALDQLEITLPSK